MKTEDSVGLFQNEPAFMELVQPLRLQKLRIVDVFEVTQFVSVSPTLRKEGGVYVEQQFPLPFKCFKETDAHYLRSAACPHWLNRPLS